ncbi:MAG: hypothetical protein IJ074_09060 [Clostridia bacterium]|nr:hypothetical protein [Clostridia bacterium]
MGTICILLGLIIFIASLLGGFTAARAYLEGGLANAIITLPQGVNAYILFIAVIGGIGLLICLNLVMHGLTYNRVNKLIRMRRHHS